MDSNKQFYESDIDIDSEDTSEIETESDSSTMSPKTYAMQFGKRRKAITKLRRSLHRLPTHTISEMRGLFAEDEWLDKIKQVRENMSQDLQVVKKQAEGLKNCVSKWENALKELESRTNKEEYEQAKSQYDKHVFGENESNLLSLKQLNEKLESLANIRQHYLEQADAALSPFLSSPPESTDSSIKSDETKEHDRLSISPTNEPDTPVLGVNIKATTISANRDKLDSGQQRVWDKITERSSISSNRTFTQQPEVTNNGENVSVHQYVSTSGMNSDRQIIAQNPSFFSRDVSAEPVTSSSQECTANTNQLQLQVGQNDTSNRLPPITTVLPPYNTTVHEGRNIHHITSTVNDRIDSFSTNNETGDTYRPFTFTPATAYMLPTVTQTVSSHNHHIPQPTQTFSYNQRISTHSHIPAASGPANCNYADHRPGQSWWDAPMRDNENAMRGSVIMGCQRRPVGHSFDFQYQPSRPMWQRLPDFPPSLAFREFMPYMYPDSRPSFSQPSFTESNSAFQAGYQQSGYAFASPFSNFRQNTENQFQYQNFHNFSDATPCFPQNFPNTHFTQIPTTTNHIPQNMSTNESSRNKPGCEQPKNTSSFTEPVVEPKKSKSNATTDANANTALAPLDLTTSRPPPVPLTTQSPPQPTEDLTLDTTTGLQFATPRIELPIFDGTKEMEFPAFYDLFIATVHLNPNVRPVIKMAVLYNHLQGDPRSLIAGVPMSDAYYETALAILKERYGNEQRIRNKIKHELGQIPPATNSLDSLSHTLTLVQATVIKLRTNKLQADHFSIIREILLKFPSSIIDNISIMKEVDTEWTTDSLLHALKVAILRREERNELTSEARTYKQFWTASSAESHNPRLESNMPPTRANTVRPKTPSPARPPFPTRSRPKSQPAYWERERRSRSPSYEPEVRGTEYAFSINSNTQHRQKDKSSTGNENSASGSHEGARPFTVTKPKSATYSRTPSPGKSRTNKIVKNRSADRLCVFCQGNHAHHLCSVCDTPRSRQRRLMELGKCLICLVGEHMANVCPLKDSRVCSHCSGKSHHVALCYKHYNESYKRKQRQTFRGNQEDNRAKQGKPESVLFIDENNQQQWADEQSNVDDNESDQEQELYDGNSDYQSESEAEENDLVCPVTEEQQCLTTPNTFVATAVSHKAKLLYTQVIARNSDTMKEKLVVVLLDSGAARSWVSKTLVEKLEINPTGHGNVRVVTFQTKSSDNNIATVADNRVTLQVKLHNGAWFDIDATVTPTDDIIGKINVKKITEEDKQFILHQQLDTAGVLRQGSYKPEIICGMNCFLSLLYGDDEHDLPSHIAHRLPSGFIMLPTLLGYILGGSRYCEEENRPSRMIESTTMAVIEDDTTDQDIPQNTLLRKRERHAAEKQQYQSIETVPFEVNESSRSCTLTTALETFQDLESLGIKDGTSDPDDEVAAKFFRDTVRFVLDEKSQTPRIMVTFPPRPLRDPLPTNRGLAYARFKGINRKLHENPDRLLRYHLGFIDLLDKHIIEPVPQQEILPHWPIHYLGHHPVYREDHATTKQRTVFDCSAKQSADSPALNEWFLRGDPLVADLGLILIRCRRYKIQIISDIAQAFLNLLIEQQCKDLTRFFWYDSLKDKNIVCYRFRALPFGLISSPHLLAYAIQYLIDKKGGKWCMATRNHWYVDNLITGVDTEEEGIELYNETVSIFKTQASLTLREWQTNSLNLRAQFLDKVRMKDTNTKILGVKWDANSDLFSLNVVDSPKDKQWTKRKVLSTANSYFDPCSYAGPVTLNAKLLYQKVTLTNMEWDQLLPEALQDECNKILPPLKSISQIKIPRYYDVDFNSDSLTLHAFADASAVCYAAVVYLRAENAVTGIVKVNFLFAKTRLNPTPRKPMSVVRMELLSLLIACRLITYTRRGLETDNIPAFTWSDNTCCLRWLKSQKSLNTFVRNRVNEIKKCKHTSNRFLSTIHNVADIATRPGVTTEDLLSSQWLTGPDWLQRSSEHWPQETIPELNRETLGAFEKEYKKSDTKIETLLPVVEPAIESDTEQEHNEFWCKFTARFSKLNTTLRVFIFIVRFLSMKVFSRLSSPLSDSTPLIVAKFDVNGSIATESKLAESLKFLILRSQRFYFSKVLSCLQNNKPHPMIRKFDLFIDEDGLLKGRSRVTFNSNLPEVQKFPTVLAKDAHITHLIINDIHFRCHHASATYILAQLNKKYWLTSARRTVKSVLRKCQTCQKLSGPPYQLPIMAPLPASRVQRGPLFGSVGVDFFGPTRVKVQCECGTTVKAWVALFTCFVTRCVFLDVVVSLTTDEFLSVFKRFISRFGQPRHVASDNAPHFILTAQLWERLHLYQEDPTEKLEERFIDYCSIDRIKWSFITPYFPQAGGSWERLVGVVKSSLKYAKGRSVPTVEAFRTMCSQCEAIVNSRPITPLESDINGPHVLRPIDLWLPHSRTGTPRVDADDITDEYLERPGTADKLVQLYASSQRAIDRFWAMFILAYLPYLRDRQQPHHRQAHRSVEMIPRIGSVVVIHDENTPRGLWKLGRVSNIKYGNDGLVRTVELRNAKGNYIERSLNKIYPLELDTESTDTTPTPPSPPPPIVTAPPPTPPVAHRTRARTGQQNSVPAAALLVIMILLPPVFALSSSSTSSAHNDTTPEICANSHADPVDLNTYFAILIFSIFFLHFLDVVIRFFLVRNVTTANIRNIQLSDQGENIEIQLLSPTARLPNPSGLSKCSFDIFAAKAVTISPHSQAIITTDLRIISAQHIVLGPCNNLDSLGRLSMSGMSSYDSRGALQALMFNHSSQSYTVETGQAFAQIMFIASKPVSLKKIQTLTTVINKTPNTTDKPRGFTEYDSLDPICYKPLCPTICHQLNSPIVKPKKPIIVVFHGNIGSGKSSVIQALQRHCPSSHKFYPEPVNDWTQFGSDKVDILNLHYRDPKRNGWRIPLLAFKSEFIKLDLKEPHEVVVYERDLLAIRMFLDAFKSKYHSFDKELLNQHADFLLSLQQCKPDVYIHLTASIPTIMRRINKRGRTSESQISTSFLREVNTATTRHLEQSDTPVITWTNDSQQFPSDDFWAQKLSLVISQISKETGRSCSTYKQPDVKTPVPVLQAKKDNATTKPVLNEHKRKAKKSRPYKKHFARTSKKHSKYTPDSSANSTDVEPECSDSCDTSTAFSSRQNIKTKNRGSKKSSSLLTGLHITLALLILLFNASTAEAQCRDSWSESQDWLVAESQICVEEGYVIYRQKQTQLLCWRKKACKKTYKNETRAVGFLNGKGECVLHQPGCECPTVNDDDFRSGQFSSCSHHPGNAEITTEMETVLDELKPSVCSFRPNDLCNPIPSHANWFIVLLYNGQTRLVDELHLISDTITNENFQCLGSGDVFTGTPEFCKFNPGCIRNAGKKLCYFKTAAPTYLATDNGQVQIQAWKQKRITFYGNKAIEAGVIEWRDSDATISCLKGGIFITLLQTPDMATICVGSYCYSLFHPKSQNMQLPRDVVINPYTPIMKIWSSGKLVKIVGSNCPASNFCELIDCWFCLEYIANPTCADSAYILIAFILFYLGSGVFYYALYSVYIIGRGGKLTCICLINTCRYCRKCCRRSTPNASETQETTQPLVKVERQTSIKRSRSLRTPLNQTLTTTMTCILLFSPKMNACTEFAMLSASNSECTIQRNGLFTCAINQITRLNLAPKHQTACLLVENSYAEAIGELEITITAIKLKCNKKTLYYTTDFATKTESVKRCPSHGSCSDTFCNSVTSNTYVPEFSTAINSAVGLQRCTAAENGWFSGDGGCFDATGFACLFYKNILQPTTGQIYETFECITFDYAIDLSVRFITQQTTESAKFTVIPGRPHSWSDITFNLISIVDKKIPLLSNRKFIRHNDRYILTKASDAGAPDTNMPGSLQCKTYKDASTMNRQNCIFNKDICSCTPYDHNPRCLCSSVDISQLFRSKELLLPLDIGGAIIEPSPNLASVEIMSEQMSSTEIQINMKNVKLKSKAYKAKCLLTPIKLTGCYNCIESAKFTYDCATDFGATIAYVNCENKLEFSIECSPVTINKTISLNLKKAKIDSKCTITCPAGDSTFQLQGLLYFTSFIKLNNVTQSEYSSPQIDSLLGLNWGTLDWEFLGSVFSSHWFISIVIIILALIILFFTIPYILPCIRFGVPKCYLLMKAMCRGCKRRLKLKTCKRFFKYCKKRIFRIFRLHSQ